MPDQKRSGLTELQQIRWLPLFNDNAEDCPPFGVFRFVRYDADTGLFHIDKPDADDYIYGIGLNGATTVPAGGYGLGSRDFPNWALYSNESTGSGTTHDGSPGYGEIWGPRAGSWEIFESQTGLRVYGGANTDESRVMVDLDPWADDEEEGSGSGDGCPIPIKWGDSCTDYCLTIIGGRLAVVDSSGIIIAGG